MYKDWELIKPYKFSPNNDLTLIGYSVAALKTSFYIPELGILLDCGIKCKYLPDFIFITHSHSDHCHELPTLFMNGRNSNKRMQVYIPNKVKGLMRNFIDSTYKLSTAKNFTNIHSRYDLHGVEVNDNINLKIKNKDYVIEILECNHSVPTVGYGFTQKRQKLKDEFRGLQGKDIKKLKDDGVIITKEERYPLFCYIGDTNVTAFNNNKITKYPIIIIECTYLYEEHKELAYKNQHIYWKDLEKVINNNKDLTFILYHFSQIYKPEEIRDFFVNKHKNIILWI